MARKQAFRQTTGTTTMRTSFDEGPSKSELKRQEPRPAGPRRASWSSCRRPSSRRWTCPRASATRSWPAAAHHEPRRDGCGRRCTSASCMRGVDVEPIRAALARRSEIDRQRVRREHVASSTGATACSPTSRPPGPSSPPRSSRRALQQMRVAGAAGTGRAGRVPARPPPPGSCSAACGKPCRQGRRLSSLVAAGCTMPR